ncbi:MAG: non-canonical purine NTP pyrophosphatase [Dehalococcoidia bacterium]
MGRQVLLATAHEGEIAELRRILAAAGWQGVTCAEAGIQPPSFGFTGPNLRERAIMRAATFVEQANLPVIALTSAYNVYAMNAQPGLRTHDFAGEGATDAEHCAKLLKEMKRVAPGQRLGLFQVAIAVGWPGEQVKVCNSTLECEVPVEQRGEGGFLFDPVTQLNNKQTLAEMSDDDRDRHSHRGMAMKQVVKHLDAMAARG